MSKNVMLAHKRWAVVGVSEKEDNFGLRIYRELRQNGYEAYPVNPRLSAVFSDKCYASLTDLPVVPEVVNVVVRPELAKEALTEAACLGVKYVWLQPGANRADVLSYAGDLGLIAEGEACALAELAKTKRQL